MIIFRIRNNNKEEATPLRGSGRVHEEVYKEGWSGNGAFNYSTHISNKIIKKW